MCPECDFHHRIGATERINQLADRGSFQELFTGLAPTDPLTFRDMKPYKDRLLAEQIKTGSKDAIKSGRMFIKGREALVCCLDLTFMMGSMGSVVGESITRTIEEATRTGLPLVIVSCSGGARMQESGLSLMQMAKTSAALARLDDAGGLFISVLTDPTTGGVTASFAMLGDVILAEPNALIGFAGPRVIRQTIRQELPGRVPAVRVPEEVWPCRPRDPPRSSAPRSHGSSTTPGSNPTSNPHGPARPVQAAKALPPGHGALHPHITPGYVINPRDAYPPQASRLALATARRGRAQPAHVARL